MSQSSAQRDPSMEEILASIRRIIEDGEDVRHDAPQVKAAEAVRTDIATTPIGPAANDVTRRPVAATGAAEAVTQALAERNARAAEQASRAAIDDMDDLALSLDDFVIDLDDMKHDESREKATRPVAGATATVAAAPSAAMRKVEPVFDTPVPSPSVKSAPEQSAVVPPVVSEVAPAPRPATPVTPTIEFSVKPRVAVTPNPAVSSAPVQAPSVAAPVPSVAAPAQAAILSRAVEKKVAASLAELSDALAASRGRSLELIAEEMMRPLLRDWLDNNLPGLVERVVREEIERIARGTA